MRIRVLGGFAVEGHQESNLGSRKARQLLKVLALARGVPVPPGRLVDALWPDQPPSRPTDQVAVLVSRLRRALGADRIHRSDAGYVLAVDWLDVDAAGELAAEAERRLADGKPAAARAAASAALRLFRGPLLPEEAGAEWVDPEAAAAARVLQKLLHLSARAAIAAGDAASAIEPAERALLEDPYDEEAARTLMAAQQASGRAAAALRTYETVRARLAEELGSDPHPDTQAVHEAVLREEPAPGYATAVGAGGRPSIAGDEDAPPTSPLVGRAAELAALELAFGRAAAGRAELVLVEGEAGIGKTRLVQTWTSAVRARGGTVLVGRCGERGSSLPLQPLADALLDALRSLGTHGADELLGSDGAVLGPLLGRTSAAPPAMADPGTGRAMMFSAALAVLGRLGAGAPVAVVLDDIHLADGSTLDWLQFARTRGERLLIVATARTEESVATAGDSVLALGPLDLEAARELVGATRAAELHGRAAGHPMLLVELAAAAGGAIPLSITEAVAARCDRAGPAAATLRTAAVMGQVVDLELLGAVLRLSPGELLEHLDEGVRRLFLEERGQDLVFRHELVRAALAEGAGATRQALVHRECGRLLSTRPGADPMSVARHAQLGGDDVLAAEALARAAEMAEARFHLDDAIDLLGQALQHDDTPEFRLRRARAFTAAARYDQAAEDANLALARGAGAPALEAAGWIAYYRRDLDGARRLAEDGVRLAEDQEILASCLLLSGRVRQGEGDLAAAEARYEQAVARARGPAMPLASVYLGQLRVQQGRLDEGLRLAERGTLAGPVRGYPLSNVYGWFARVHALLALGRLQEALHAVDRFGEEARQVAAARFYPRVSNFRGAILRALGHIAEADECSQAALQQASADGLAEPHAYALLDLADSMLLGHDPASATLLLEQAEALQHVKHVNAWRHELKARLARARLSILGGNLEDAWIGALAVAEDAGQLGVLRYSAAARVVETTARVLGGQPVDEDAVAGHVADLRRASLPEALWLVAELAAATGSPRWAGEVEAVAASLAAGAGEHREGYEAWVSKRLDEVGIRRS